MTYQRYVALGDSQTEGLGDWDEIAGYRGWADRLAGQLALANPGLQYANLAVRGLGIAQIRAGQLEPALALQPDIATVLGGMNDLIRPGFRAAEVVAEMEEMFAALTAASAVVATITLPDIGKIAPLAKRLRPRVIDFNARLTAAADRHGVLVADTYPHAFATDSRMWSADRLHASPIGHARIAAAMGQMFGLPGSDGSWTLPLDPQARPTAWQATRTELTWIGSFLAPWAYRRLRGRSTGDGRTAKRPHLTPVALPVGDGLSGQS
jgi:lysophospholipase L1-like esterase